MFTGTYLALQEPDGIPTKRETLNNSWRFPTSHALVI